jgi:hypothetical protein
MAVDFLVGLGNHRIAGGAGLSLHSGTLFADTVHQLVAFHTGAFHNLAGTAFCLCFLLLTADGFSLLQLPQIV